MDKLTLIKWAEGAMYRVMHYTVFESGRLDITGLRFGDNPLSIG